ncbi:Hypothetical protein D9617_64g101310 [Elsinoe fawcettii]|nr:Hypothetical protein D9617_64g101310 [Elsinoe fawcettii]
MVKLQRASYKAYKQVRKRLICFAYRSTLHDCGVRLAHQLTPKQRISLDRLLLRAEAVGAAALEDGSSAGDHAPNDRKCQGKADGADLAARKQTLDRECLVFCISLLDHTLKGDIYESVVVGFLAILGIDVKARTFMSAYAYTPTLSKFIKIGQMLVAQRAVLPVEEGETDDPADLLDDMRDRFLVYGSRSPFSWASKLRMYGRKVRSNTTCLGYISWSDDQETLTY